jgi:hypothetical protein
MRLPSFTVALVMGALGTLLGLAACRPSDSARPVGNCTEACNARASKHCSDHDCARGCTFILDRLAEKETTPILACVASASGVCDDMLWATCAVRVGPHADGGPPAPLPPED